jgi:spermidine synthase
MIMGALYLHPNPQKILVIGLGGASLPTSFMKILPESEIHIVELDPAVVRVAKKYFNFQPNAKVQVSEEDGRAFVRRAGSRGEKYDLIVLDAFGDTYIPEHMMTIQFLQEVKNILKPDGVLASNTFSTSKTYDRESATYQSAFGSFYNLKKILTSTRVILIKQDGLPPLEVLKENSVTLENKLRPLGVKASWLLPLFTAKQDWDNRAKVLNDKLSPFFGGE